MKQATSKQIYEMFRDGRIKYDEEVHCQMILDILPKKWRISAFCVEAKIGERTFMKWVNQHPIFGMCYRLAAMQAREAWEEEEEENLDNPEWDRKTWVSRGSRYFGEDKSKLVLEVDPTGTPWEQYQQILAQASNGDFNASEVKQLMESINVGTRVYETFKLQAEVDKMNEELKEMSQRNGNNSSTVIKIENTD